MIMRPLVSLMQLIIGHVYLDSGKDQKKLNVSGLADENSTPNTGRWRSQRWPLALKANHVFCMKELVNGNRITSYINKHTQSSGNSLWKADLVFYNLCNVSNKGSSYNFIQFSKIF